MHYPINVTSFEYTGDKVFTYKTSQYKILKLKKGDVISLTDNHFAKSLRKKSFFKELSAFAEQEQETQQAAKAKAKAKAKPTQEEQSLLQQPQEEQS